MEHLRTNVEALGLQLSPQDIADIEKGYDFDLGFPHTFIGPLTRAAEGPEDVPGTRSLGYFDYVQAQQPIKPHQGDLSAQWRP